MSSWPAAMAASSRGRSKRNSLRQSSAAPARRAQPAFRFLDIFPPPMATNLRETQSPGMKTQSSGMKPKVSELHPISLLCALVGANRPPNASNHCHGSILQEKRRWSFPARVWNGQRIANGAHKSGMLSGPRSPCWPHWASRFRAVIFSISPSYLTHVQPPSRYEFLNGEKGVFHAQFLAALEIMVPGPQLNR